MKVLILNGANLNVLGAREKEHYGSSTLREIKNLTTRLIKENNLKVDVTWKQSNLEGEIVNFIQDAIGKYEAIVINPGGYSHTSVSILDALKVYDGIVAEVHLSRVTNRPESFRKNLITAQAADILLEGLVDLSYFIGVLSVFKKFNLRG